MAFACIGNGGQICPRYSWSESRDTLIPRRPGAGFFARRRQHSIINNVGLGLMKDQTDRRSFISGIIIQTASFLNVKDASATGTVKDFREQVPVTVTLPLEPASGGTFCVRCTLFEPTNHPSIPADVFKVYRAIVDTGECFIAHYHNLYYQENSYLHKKDRHTWYSRLLDFIIFTNAKERQYYLHWQTFYTPLTNLTRIQQIYWLAQNFLLPRRFMDQ